MAFAVHGQGVQIPRCRHSTPTRLIEDPQVADRQSPGDGIRMSTRWTWNPLAMVFTIIALGSCSRGDGSGMPSGIDSHSMPEGSPSIVGSIPSAPEAAADPPYDLSADIADRTRFVRARFGNATRVEIEGDAFVVADPDHGAPVRSRRVADASGDPCAPIVGVLPIPTGQGCHCPPLLFACILRGFLEGTLWIRSPGSLRLVDGTSGLPTLTHEIVHPFMQHEAARLPAWIDEGDRVPLRVSIALARR